MKTSELDYQLPPDRIAQLPLADRDASRLLVVDRSRGTLAHHSFGDIASLLSPGDAVIRNVSRVIPARLLGTRASGGRAEFLAVSRLATDRWRAFVRPARRLAEGDHVTLGTGFRIEILSRASKSGSLAVIGAPGLDEEIDRSGVVPLPPYIRRAPEPTDRQRYQTVYATTPGSVAAPTAGLHFTEAVLARLIGRGLTIGDVVLHVGPGTFLPVRSETLDDHHMHEESYYVPESTALQVQSAQAAGRRVLAVGTTSLRALESASTGGTVTSGSDATTLFIRPGYRFRAVSALLTNFHQPRSTLLALVLAFAGNLMWEAYHEALRSEYRFLSYGDAMLIL